MVLLMLLSFLAGQDPSDESRTVFVDRIAIKVNDKIITERELISTYKQLRRETLKQHTGAELDRRLKEAWDNAIKTAEESLLLYEKALEVGVAFSRDDTLSQMLSIKESNGMSDEEFEAAVKEQTDMSLEMWVDARMRDTSANAVIHSQVVNKIKVDDSEIAKYYQLNQQEFMQPATYRIAEVVCLKANEGAAAARTRAENCLAMLANGSDFAEVARSFSDSPSKEDGGDLGDVNFGDLLSTIEDNVRTMQVGSHSQILETDAAYFIIKLINLTPEQPKPLEVVHGDILDRLREPKIDTEIKAYIEKLKVEYLLQTYIKEVPWYLEL